jgi:hypothetical protein
VAADQRNLPQFVFRLIGCQLLTCDLICYQLCGDLFATCHFRCPSLLFRCPRFVIRAALTGPHRLRLATVSCNVIAGHRPYMLVVANSG